MYAASGLPMKRTALTDNKTGMPMFQPLHQLAGGPAIHHLHSQPQPIGLPQQLATLNYPGAFNFGGVQYAPYPATFTLPCNLVFVQFDLKCFIFHNFLFFKSMDSSRQCRDFESNSSAAVNKRILIKPIFFFSCKKIYKQTTRTSSARAK